MKISTSSISRVALTALVVLAWPRLAAAQTNVSGTISTSTTWTLAGSPYIVTGDIYVQNSAPPAPILTIQAGTTVKFNSGVNMYIGWSYPGGLQAVGTSASPIVFTANGSTTPGFWRGIQMNASTSSTQISFATVSYGGLANNWGGIYVIGCSPTISNVTLQNNVHSGIAVYGGAPTIVNNSFIGNTAGLVNTLPANIISARLNYWNAASGPSGAGSGTGQSVSAGVKFEPWLIAAPSTPQYFNTANQLNRTFNPSIQVNTTITSGTVLSGNWTVSILNSGGTTIRT